MDNPPSSLKPSEDNLQFGIDQRPRLSLAIPLALQHISAVFGETVVASRFVVMVSGIFLIILGIFPKLAALITAMPYPVLGGAAIIMFGIVATAGIKILSKVEFSRRNMLVIAISFGLGLGVVFRPEILSNLPQAVQIVFSSGITTGTLVAIILNLILPQKTTFDTT